MVHGLNSRQNFGGVPSFHEPENARLDSEGLTRFRFTVPMQAEKNRKGAFHEPCGSGAGVPPAARASRTNSPRGRDARSDSRDGCPTSDRPAFRVPIGAQSSEETFMQPDFRLARLAQWRRASPLHSAAAEPRRSVEGNSRVRCGTGDPAGKARLS